MIRLTYEIIPMAAQIASEGARNDVEVAGGQGDYTGLAS